MFNRYMAEDREAFEDLYRPVEEEVLEESHHAQKPEESEPSLPAAAEIKKEEDKKSVNASKKIGTGFPDFKRLLKGLDIGDIGLLPLLLLAFLILDVENDEKLLIVALAIVLGI